MNIVKSGSSYMVYGEGVETFDALPVGTYRLSFSPMMGFFLEGVDDLCVSEKVYGLSPRKVTKVLASFRASDRNFGVILSGPKGVGKSLFARMLAEKGRRDGLPLILVQSPYDGVDEFISSIRQECIVLFDEFEKNFREDKDEHQQEALLSLFDGLDGGKKLFVVTCNDPSKLSNYLVNRPGRFHYHFVMGPPDGDGIREYLEDHLREGAKADIGQIVTMGEIYGFTYDILRALAFELNQGAPLGEALEDLNMECERYLSVMPVAIFGNGARAYGDTIRVDMHKAMEAHSEWCNFYKTDIDARFWKDCKEIRVEFHNADIQSEAGKYIVPKDAVDLLWIYAGEDSEDGDGSPTAYGKALAAYRDSFKLSKVVLQVEPAMFARKYIV